MTKAVDQIHVTLGLRPWVKHALMALAVLDFLILQWLSPASRAAMIDAGISVAIKFGIRTTAK